MLRLCRRFFPQVLHLRHQNSRYVDGLGCSVVCFKWLIGPFKLFPSKNQKSQAAKVGHPDVDKSPTALTTDMLLTWKAAPGSLVAFVALEQQVIVRNHQVLCSADLTYMIVEFEVT